MPASTPPIRQLISVVLMSELIFLAFLCLAVPLVALIDILSGSPVHHLSPLGWAVACVVAVPVGALLAMFALIVARWGGMRA